MSKKKLICFNSGFEFTKDKKMQSNSLSWKNRYDTRKLTHVLKQGGLAVGGSDTILGFLAPLTQQGFDKLNFLKGRSGRPYLILTSSRDKIRNFVAMPLTEQVDRLITRCWPGPLTLILPVKKGLPRYIIGDGNTVALRIPDHDGLLTLLSHFDGLFSTSANRAGEFVPIAIKDIDVDIMRHVSAVIDDSNLYYMSQPSTILDCSGSDIVIIREGVYPVEELEKIAGVSFIKR